MWLGLQGLTTQAAVPVPTPLPQLSYPAPDTALGEQLYPNEAAYTAQIAQTIEQTIRQEYSAGTARRDAHPKAHGCVKAQFTVLDTIPLTLKQGIFAKPRNYSAWIRFSNGSRHPDRPDYKGDARGMAIKLLNVAGTPLVNDDAQGNTQDFILINHPVFFINEPQRYLSLHQHIQGNWLQKIAIPFDLGFKGSKIALQTTRSKIANPLQARYFSMVPYQLGVDANRQAIKYSVRPCVAQQDKTINRADPNYLRQALKTTLANGDACMEFMLQPRTSNSMPVEDSMTEWKETEAPFYPVARIVIAQQQFDTPAQNELCENLSFSPWHALPQHKPLGVTNRMRKVIYNHISRVRHDMNGKAP